MGTADECGVQDARELDVVEVAPGAAEQCRIFETTQALTDEP